MIDLHCHLLPGIDDGPANLGESLALARLAVAQGITTVACTPHILPGVYNNNGHEIRSATLAMQDALDLAGIGLRLVTGADVHLTPENIANLKSGHALSLADTRYVLIEPPTHVIPPRIDHAFFSIAAAGYFPILTHPERMSWIERHYDVIERLSAAGVLMQITAASITGGFGRRARYWSEKMLDDGIAGLVATDAHNADRRPPLLMEAYEAVSIRIGEEQARTIFIETPEAILQDQALINRSRPGQPYAEAGVIASQNWLGMTWAWMRRS